MGSGGRKEEGEGRRGEERREDLENARKKKKKLEP